MNKEILVVVDMQDEFETSAKVVDNCLKLIRQYKLQNNPILFLEYCEYGLTNFSLYKEVDGYKNIFVFKKNTDSGAEEICKFTKIGFQKYDFAFCGVNTEYCVYETISSLRERRPKHKISLHADACNSPNHKRGIYKIHNVKEIKIIQEKLNTSKMKG